MSFDEFTGLPLSAMDPDKPFDEWTGLPLPAMDLDNSTRQPGLTDEVMRLALLSKTQRQAELASKQAAFNQAQSGTLTDDQAMLMAVTITILQAIKGADEACPSGSKHFDWWFYLADFFRNAAKKAAVQDVHMISKRSVEEAATKMAIMGWGAIGTWNAMEADLAGQLGGIMI